MSASQDRLGEIVAGHRLGRDGLILLGWSAEGMPEQGVAILKKRQPVKGRFGAATWSDGARRWFLLLVHATEAGLSQTGDGFQLHGAGVQSATTAYTPPAILDCDGFAGAILTHLGARAGEAVRFLMETLPAMAEAEPARHLVTAALHAAAEESGVIEIVGRADGESLLLQGWIRDPHKVEPRLLIDSGRLQEHDAVFATFGRSDLAAPAVGFVALVRHEAAAGTAPRQIYLRNEGGYRRLTVLPTAVHLREEDVPHHLTSLMPNLRADAAGQRTFRAACRPRFTGQDTVSSLHLPVRMAIDLAARVPGAGWYVTGWLLDPGKLVTAVLLRTADGVGERLDATWTRLARPDVRDGFAGDPLFAGGIADDLHGFTVFVPRVANNRAEGAAAWIELDLGGRSCAFMPVSPVAIEGADGDERLLASIDPHKAAAGEIIERQLAPLYHARAAAPKRRVAYRAMRDGAADGRAAVIVPIDAATRTNVVVAHLARCRFPEPVRTVFVCSATASDAARRLSRDLDFYGIAADVLLAAEPVDHCAALELGVDVTRTPLLLFLSPRVHGLGPAWPERLLAALGEGDAPVAVSPTLLYEDGSVRYAGIDAVQFGAAAPYAAAVCGRAGYPRGALPQADGSTLACAIECCAMTRSAFEAVGGFSRGFASDGFKGIDLFLRMGAAGVALRWTAAAELYALDDQREAAEANARVAKLVDGWCFRAAWQARPLPHAAGDERAAGAAVVALPDVSRARARAVG